MRLEWSHHNEHKNTKKAKKLKKKGEYLQKIDEKNKFAAAWLKIFQFYYVVFLCHCSIIISFFVILLWPYFFLKYTVSECNLYCWCFNYLEFITFMFFLVCKLWIVLMFSRPTVGQESSECKIDYTGFTNSKSWNQPYSRIKFLKPFFLSKHEGNNKVRKTNKYIYRCMAVS